MGELVKFGSTVQFKGERLGVPTYDQTLPGLRVGVEGERVTQRGQVKGKQADWSGGLIPSIDIQPWAQFLNVYKRNEGIQTRLPGLGILPPDVINQSTLLRENIVVNGGIEVDTTGWSTPGGNSAIERSTDKAKFGSASLKVTFNGTGTAGTSTNVTAAAAGEHEVVAYVYIDPAFSGAATHIQLVIAGFTGSSVIDFSETQVAIAGNTGKWVKLRRVVSLDAGDLAGAVQVNASGGTPDSGAIFYLDGVKMGRPNDEDISSAIANNWRLHELKTSLGDTEERYYCAVGHKLFRNVGSADDSQDGAGLEVADTFTDVVTAIGLLNVNGSTVLAVATNGATDDIKYTTDPTAGTITWVTLVALSAGDYITGMEFFPTLGSGINIIVGEVGGTNGIWYMDAETAAPWTLRQVVDEATKDKENTSIAVRTTLDVVPQSAWADNTVKVNSSATASRMSWSNPGNIFADDNAYASCSVGTDNAITDKSGYLFAHGFDFNAIPRGALIKGINLEVRKLEDGAGAANVVDADIRLILGGAASTNRANADTEWPTGETTVSYGDSDEDGDDAWGEDIRGADLDSLLVRIQIGFNAVPSANTSDVRVEQVKLSLVWRLPGAMPSLPLGGWKISKNPAAPNRMAVVTPTEDDAATITKPREVWFLDFLWDSGQDRPTVTLSQPNEGMPYVWHACPHQGGYAVCGGNKASDRGIFLKQIDEAGELRNFNFPGVHGSEVVKINSMYSQGSWLLADVIDSDEADAQWWVWGRGSFYPDFLLQSLSGLAIAAQPIPRAEVALNTEDAVIYRIFPNSLDTAVSRHHLYSDLGSDPRLVEASVVKTDATPKLTSVELDYGHEELNKMLTVVAQHSRQVSAQAGSYGAVTLEISTDGGTTFASSNIFDSAFEEWEPAGAIRYRTLVYRVSMNHEAGSSKTPNATDFLCITVQTWPEEQEYIWEVPQEGLELQGKVGEVPIFHWLSQLASDINTSGPILKLTFEDNQSVHAVFEGVRGTESPLFLPTQVGASAQRAAPKGESVVLAFRSVPGQVA